MNNYFWTILFLLILSQETISLEDDLKIDWATPLATWPDVGESFNSDLHPSTHITDPANDNFALNLTPGSASWAADEHTSSSLDNFHRIATQALEPSDVTGHESTFLSWPAPPDQSETTELACSHRYPQPEWLAQSSTHFVPNTWLGSTSDEGAHKTDAAAPGRKRTEIQAPLYPHPPTPPNSISFGHEHTINAYSRPLDGFDATSTDHDYGFGQVMNEHQSAHPMIVPAPCAQDYVVWPFLNLFDQSGAHQQNKLNQNPDDNYPDHPMRTSQIKFGISQFSKKQKRKSARPFDNRGSEKGAQKKLKRKKIQSNEPIPASSQKHPAYIFPTKQSTFEYRWVDFEPSTLDGQLVMEVLDDFRLDDGTNFFNFAAKHGKEPGRIIQSQFPQKIFCLEFLDAENLIEFFRFFRMTAYPLLPYLNERAKSHLATATKKRFTLVNHKYEGISAHQERILEYKTLVLRDFEESIKTCQNRMALKLGGKPDLQKANFFNRMRDLFPLYLLYVDLINALIPVQALDKEGKLLKTQRKIAGERFLELVEEALLNNQRTENVNDQNYHKYKMIDEFSKSVQKPYSSIRTDFALMWKAIGYWILTSREELRKQDLLGRNFKMFFNHLVRNGIGKIAQL